MALVDVAKRMLMQRGTIWTLRKKAAATGANSWTQGAVTPSYHHAQGASRQFSAKIVRDGIQSGDLLVVLSTAIDATPARGDAVAVGALTADTDLPAVKWLQIVDEPNAPSIAGKAAVWRLHVRA